LLKNSNLNLKIFDECEISKKLRQFQEEIGGKKYPVIMSDDPEKEKGNILWQNFVPSLEDLKKMIGTKEWPMIKQENFSKIFGK